MLNSAAFSNFPDKNGNVRGASQPPNKLKDLFSSVLSLSPFGVRKGSVETIDAKTLVEFAVQSILKSGHSNYAMRLIYRAIDLDPFQPQALLALSDYYRSKNKGPKPEGEELYAGLILEYAMSPKCTILPSEKPSFEKARHDLMLRWGFVRTPGHPDGDMDQVGYTACINKIMKRGQATTEAIKDAHTALGVHIGLLDARKWKPTPAYREWLRSDASTIHG